MERWGCERWWWEGWWWEAAERHVQIRRALLAGWWREADESVEVGDGWFWWWWQAGWPGRRQTETRRREADSWWRWC